MIERLGVNTVAYASLSSGEGFCSLLPGSAPIRVDEPMPAGIRAADCHLFDADGIAFERHVDWQKLEMPEVTAA